ncbi:MAG: hypothetical protein JNJ54_28095 [Myxococcaceae bacterium]|nr:hypothetical protein [Myxococcaceae bacterium]
MKSVLWVGVVLAVLTGCSSSPVCDARTCAVGCCSLEGLCLAGASVTSCGRGGQRCESCAADRLCSAGVCEPFGSAGAGAGGGSSGGSAGGLAVGGGSVGGGSSGGAAGGLPVGGGAAPDAGVRCSRVPVGRPSTDPWARERTTVDQPDDEPGAAQVHVLYLEPADRTATRQLDVEGDLRRSIAAFTLWLAAQTGGPRIRFDTCDGAVDITFVKLSVNELELASGLNSARPGVAFIRERLRDLVLSRFSEPNKLYLLFYEGLAYGYCGGASYPPQLSDHYTAIYRGGIFAATFVTAATGAGQTAVPVDSTASLPAAPFDASLGSQQVRVIAKTATSVTVSAPLGGSVTPHTTLRAMTTIPECRANALSPDGQALGYAEFATLHELLHPLGIVGSGATDFAQSPVAPGHLAFTNPAGGDDLMYQGTQPWTCSTAAPNAAASRCRLDPSRRNYWGVGNRTNVVDLARSAFLSPTPAQPQLPPGW